MAGEGVTASNWATVTTVAEGEVANTFDYAAQEGTDLANYAVTVVTGRIAVVAAQIPVGSGGSVEAIGYTNVYDGVAHGIAVSVNGLQTMPTVQYRAGVSGDWADATPTFSNVCDTQVWYRVSAPNYAPAVGSAGIKIAPRAVTVTVAGHMATYAYDTTEKSVSGYDAATEDALYDIAADTVFNGTAAASRTDAGTTAMGLASGDFANNNANFHVTYEVADGWLRVTPRVIGDDPSNWDIRLARNPMYDGTEQSAPITQVAFVKPDGNLDDIPYALSGNTATDAGNYVVRITGTGNYAGTVERDWAITPRNVTLTSGHAEWVYDGAAHSESGVTVSGDGFAPGEGAAYSGFPVVRHVADAAEALANAFAYAFNANTKAQNYEVTTRFGTVKMRPRAITLTAPTKEKQYDGTPLTFGADEVEAVATGAALPGGGHGLPALPEGEAFTLGDFARITEAGRADATFTVADGTALMSDYAITIVPGTLTVTRNATQITVTAKSGSWTYDGQPRTLHEYEATNLGVLQLGDVLDVAFSDDSVVTTPIDGPEQNGVVANVIAGVRVLRGEADVTSNYTLAPYNGTLTVTRRPVTLTSRGASKTYDGEPLTAHEVEIGGDGFVGEDGAAYVFTGEQTVKGTSKNAFVYTLKDGTDAAFYDITKVEGDLEVTAADIAQGGEADWQIVLGPTLTYMGTEQTQTLGFVAYKGLTLDYSVTGNQATDAGDYQMTLRGQGNFTGEKTINWSIAPKMLTLTAGSGSKVYDGAALTVNAVVADGFVAGEGANFTCVGSQKDVGSSVNAVAEISWNVNTKGSNYAVTKLPGTLAVTPRPVTLTSKSDTKVYDGTPLTAHEVTVGGDGFVDGEGAAYAFTGAQTAVGTSENTFTYTLNGNTAAGNYEIATVNGTLTVTKANIGGGEGGGDEPGDGEIQDGGLSKFDTAFVYDGAGHTIDTNSLHAAFGAAMIGESVVEYAAGGSQSPATVSDAMNCIPPCFTNAGEYVVWYKVTNPNYEDFVHAAKVTIAKRPVTVRSRSLTKPYDGTPLTFGAAEIEAVATSATLPGGGQGLPALPEGESFAYGDFAERTAAGETEATFTVSAGAGTDLANYDITTEYGTLTVTKATYPGQEPGGAGIAWSVASDAATWMYDGQPHGVALTGVPAGVTARLAGHEAVDAGDYVATVTLDYDAANYEPPSAPAPLAWSITKRPLTLMAASKEKPYDGFPLAVRPGDITASGSGYADGECLDYVGFASITDVGETAATFSYRDSATAKVANYDITVVGGQTLKVTVGGDQISVTADSATWAYDGAEHRAASWRVENGDKLLAGHELRVAIDPASVVRTPADGPDGDGVVSNRFASVRIVEAATGADRTRNYNLVLKEGVLKMTNACIRAEQVAGADDIAKVYDGVATQVVVTAALLQPATVRYFADDISSATGQDTASTGQSEPPRFTHATNVVVWFTVAADYYAAYTGRVDVAIAKRAVTLTTPTKTKTYDGVLLTFGAGEVAVGGDGFAPGESFTFSDFASIADAGRVAARCAYAAATGAALPDYAVTEEWGTLTVLASADEITVTADSATWAYDGTAHRLASYTAENADKLQPGDALDVAFAPESVVLTPEDGPEGDGVVSNAIASVRVLRHGTEDVTRNYSLAWYPGVLRVTKARMTFDGEGAVDPSEFSTTATYDGAGHTAAVVPPSLLTAPVTVRYYGAVATSATLPARGNGAVATSATLPEEGTWRGEAPAFTNAGVHTVFYALDARHYETYFGTATVTIMPRPVTLVSGGAEKVYDGTPLRCDAVRVKAGSPGFVGDEGFAATCSGALTDVGAMENLFDYALTGGALAGNYTITKEYGWLRVTPATLDPGAVFGGGETDADGGPLCARVYNGAPQPFALAPAFGEPYRLSYALVPGDESAYSETAPTRTHVAEGDLAVYFKFLSPNYAPYYGKGTLRIVPKALTAEMCVADEDAAWFFDGTEKRPAVTVVDGDPNIATADDYTLAYSGRTGAGLFPVTVTGRNNYTGTVTKAFAILKRPVAPPVIPSRAYSGRLQRPTITADARWTVVANPGGTDAGLYTNVVLRLANTADYKWKGLDEDTADWTGVFEIRKGANGWSTYPGIRSWTNGVEAASGPTGHARFGTLSVAYRRRGAPVETETAEKPSAPGQYTARFWVEESRNYAGCGLTVPYEVDFEIFRGPDDPPAGTATTTTLVPVPYAWLDAYVDRFGGGDYEAAAHATGANGVALWESYVAGLDPTDAASRFTAKIALGADGTPRITWSPDLREAEPPRAYTVHGKPDLGAAAWTPVTDANRATLRFFKVTVEIR